MNTWWEWGVTEPGSAAWHVASTAGSQLQGMGWGTEGMVEGMAEGMVGCQEVAPAADTQSLMQGTISFCSLSLQCGSCQKSQALLWQDAGTTNHRLLSTVVVARPQPLWGLPPTRRRLLQRLTAPVLAELLPTSRAAAAGAPGVHTGVAEGWGEERTTAARSRSGATGPTYAIGMNGRPAWAR